MKKTSQVIISISLILISFFYTNKMIDILKNNDPIMKTIKSKEESFKIDAVDAKIENSTITPGLNGSKINLNDSYDKMKKYGEYNESLMVFEEVEPTVSVNNNYDKYIVSGNENVNNVSLIFKVFRDDSVDDILDIIEEYKVNATFFVDGLWLENNSKKVVYMSELDQEIEILNYDSNYQKKYFESAVNISNTLTGKDAKYCYTETERKDVLNLCRKLNLHTVIPSIITDENPFGDIKDEIENGSIISMPLGAVVEKQLPTIIDFIRQRGFKIVPLSTLLNEENNVN